MQAFSTSRKSSKSKDFHISGRPFEDTWQTHTQLSHYISAVGTWNLAVRYPLLLILDSDSTVQDGRVKPGFNQSWALAPLWTHGLTEPEPFLNGAT